MLKVFAFICWVWSATSQSNLVWSPPNQFFTQTVSLVQGLSIKSLNKQTTITYPIQFNQIPKVILSLSSLEQLSAATDITLTQTVIEEQLTYFIHQIYLDCNKSQISKLKIVYAAINMLTIPFLFPHQLSINTFHLGTSSTPDSEFFLIKYLTGLEATHYYEITAILTGFTTKTQSQPFISIGSQLYNSTHYLVRATARNNNLQKVEFTRILIDRTIELQQASNYSYIQIEHDLSIHYQLSTPSYPSTNIQYFSTSLFYGVKSFTSSFNCLSNGSIFQEPSPKVDIQMTFLSILQKSCPTSQVLFQQNTQLCYESCQIGKYHVGINLCQLCHFTCYQCSGPSQFECTDCLEGDFRKMNNLNACQCMDNFYHDAPNSLCLSCSNMIQGCEVCNEHRHCTQCDAVCHLSGTTCNCPAGYQGCGDHQYFDSLTSECKCLPQYYMTGAGACQTCDKGCYICEQTSSKCLSCVNQYILVSYTCIFFSKTSFLIDGNKAVFGENDRCSAKTPEGLCMNNCSASSYFYDHKCYPSQCPVGTFEVVDAVTGEGRCHPCNPPCIECVVFYLCKRCEPQFYYLNESSLCYPCPTGCLHCTSIDACSSCLNGFSLINGTTCVENFPTENVVCASDCAICLISAFCQQCFPGYFLLDDTHECIQCYRPGLELRYPPPEIASLEQQCYEICGDGYVYNDQCDDGNTDSGDGCSSECKIEDDYECQYLHNFNKSACFKQQFNISINMSRNLLENELEIDVEGEGISLNLIPFVVDCGLDTTLISTVLYNKRIHFKISFKGDVTVCEFKVDGSVYIPEEQIKVQTKPRPLYVNEDSLIRHLVYKFFQYMFHPYAYVFLVYCALGISPFDIWISYQFIVMTVMVMHEKQHNPPGVYGVYSYLQSFYFNTRAEDTSQAFYEAGWRILILYGSVLLIHSVLVPCILKMNCLCTSLQNILNNIYRKRVLLYVCIHSIFQPIGIMICFYTFEGGNFQVMRMVVVSFHMLAILFSGIFLMVYCDDGLVIKNHRKYMLFLMLMKPLNFLIAAKVYYTHSKYYVTTSIQAIFLMFFLFYTGFDSNTAYETVQYEKDNTLSVEERSQQNEEQQRKCCTVIRLLTLFRKAGLIVVFFSFICFCATLMMYESERLNPKNYQFQSLMILMILTGSLIVFAQVANLINHILVIMIYKESVEEDDESIKEPEKSEQRFNNNRERSHISVISISGDGSQYAQDD